jgi:glutamine amidotransferase
MRTVLVDYEAGNLHSAEKAFQRMAAETGAGEILVTGDPDAVAGAGRIVLPGDGAFAACRAALEARPGLMAALHAAVIGRRVPFMGICVGMQMLADMGEEGGETPGLGWIGGAVRRIRPDDPTLKIPHMGWNDLKVEQPHPLLDGVATGDHVYFVHSYRFEVADRADLLATARHGAEIAAVIARGNIVGTQFHPEKSQATGLRMIANFLRWQP